MKLLFHLAYKNLVGAGLRTWLNVGILSFVYIIIVFYNGFVDGLSRQGTRNSIEWEIGNGELLNNKYDPYNAFTLLDGHGILPADKEKNLVPVLIRQATIYPQGRMVSILIKGIETNQTILKIPTQLFTSSTAKIPALIGKQMAASTNLKAGDEIMLRWRDKNGTFDAANITIAGIFDTQVATIDIGQIWIPIKKLRQMTDLNQHTTLFIAVNDYVNENISGWNFKSQYDLLSNIRGLIRVEKVGDYIIYLLLLAIAMLAIFDTQVLSIFRRQREIGTYISLGMTRAQVAKLFTIEGCMYSLFATVIGAVFGTPLFIYFAHAGIGTPSMQGLAIPIANIVYPVYGVVAIVSTIVLVVVPATIVSFLPARKISQMNPVDALKGKVQ